MSALTRVSSFLGLAALLWGLSVSTLWACEQSKADKHFSKLTERLQLTDEQAPEVKSIFEAYKQEMRGNREQISGSRETLRTNLATVLTEEQMNAFLAMPRLKYRHAHKNDDRSSD